MNFIEPIRDRKKIAQIKNPLRGHKRIRDLLLFVVGVNTALHISDLLQLQVNHFLDEQRRIQRRFWIKERKRGKRHEVVINTSIREALDEYLAAYPGLSRKFIKLSKRDGLFSFKEVRHMWVIFGYVFYSMARAVGCWRLFTASRHSFRSGRHKLFLEHWH